MRDRSSWTGRLADATGPLIVPALIVTEVCYQSTMPLVGAAPNAFAEKCYDLVQVFRDQYAPMSTDKWQSDTTVLRRALERQHSGKCPPPELEPEDAIWPWICYICSHANLLNASGVVSVTGELLDAFSDLRRSVMLSILLTGDADQAAKTNDVSHRTVRATIRAAIEMLSKYCAGGGSKAESR
jgi:hypothetical protein